MTSKALCAFGFIGFAALSVRGQSPLYAQCAFASSHNLFAPYLQAKAVASYVLYVQGV